MSMSIDFSAIEHLMQQLMSMLPNLIMFMLIMRIFNSMMMMMPF